MLLYLTFLLVLSTSMYSKEIQTGNQKISSFKVNCKNIKCPPVEDPICVRIKTLNDKNKKVTFIVAINKCEMQYAKCRPGIDAVKVPMNNCLHAPDSKNASNKRIKRATSDEMPSIAIFVAKNNSDQNHDNKDQAATLLEGSAENKSKKIGLEVEEEEDIKGATDKPLIEDDDKIGNDEDRNHIGADYDHAAQDVDYIQYEKDCPTVCPARKVMVCARCQHSIYRTFLSPCHLRVFHCKYPDEKLELVNRQPCMQSAPFLTNFAEAKGIVSEPGDQDDILKFIYCREKGRFSKDDSRCKFEEK